jgi:hypothetical protein
LIRYRAELGHIGTPPQFKKSRRASWTYIGRLILAMVCRSKRSWLATVPADCHEIHVAAMLHYAGFIKGLGDSCKS